MKRSILAAFALSLLASSLAFADFKTDSIPGAIKGTVIMEGGDADFVLNANRTEFTIGAETYTVTRRESDKSTYVKYLAKGAYVLFADREDKVHWDGHTAHLSVRQ